MRIQIANDNVVNLMPILYGKAKNDKIKVIQYYVRDEGNGICSIVNVHGYIDGKKQTDVREIKSGKNIGRSNETSVEEQAILEMESKWKAKKDSNYTENKSGEPDDSEKSLLPMLAHRFQQRKHNIIYPCIVQPKLNGVRCMARKVDGEIIATSRKFKEYTTLDHIKKELLPILGNNMILDGEIYSHGMSLQEINRRVKKYRPGKTEQLEYWVYDIADKDKTFKERMSTIRDISGTYQKHVHFLESHIANSEGDVHKYHDDFVHQGYEGVIIRNLDGKYLFEKRSADLQKYKEFMDSEFKIIGTKSGEGRDIGTIIFVCETAEHIKFNIRPRGTVANRKEMFNNSSDYVGKYLTVRYQELSDDGVPIFPVGIVVRLDEDLP